MTTKGRHRIIHVVSGNDQYATTFGNAGIGVTKPSTKLHVSEDISATTYLTAGDNYLVKFEGCQV